MNFFNSHSWLGFLSLLQKEVARFMKVFSQTVLNPMVSSSLYLLIFGVSLAQSIQTQGGVDYLAFLIPGVIMMSLLNNSFQNSSSSIIISKFHGDLQDLKYVPLSPTQITWAYSLGSLLRGSIVAGSVFAVGQVFYYMQFDQLLPIHHPFLLFYFIIIGSLTFSGLGMSVAFWANNFDKVNAVGTFVLLPLIYLGGVFFSLNNLHPFWQYLSKLNPLLYLINGFRFGFVGATDVPMGWCIIISLIAFGITHSLAHYFVRQGSFTRF